jgi:peptidyl-prolyl cis-trans isomerase SurA
LSEILVSTGTGDDPAKMAAAKAKADDIESPAARRRRFQRNWQNRSATVPPPPRAAIWANISGRTAQGARGQDLSLKAGQVTDPILTRQGYIILKVVAARPRRPAAIQGSSEQVEDAFYMSRMEPAIRANLTKMREDAFIDIKPGYTSTPAQAQRNQAGL